MNMKRLLGIFLSITMVLVFSACKKDVEEDETGAPIVTGGSVEDVFNVKGEGDDEPTIDSGLIDTDSGMVTVVDPSDTSIAKNQTTTKASNKKETTTKANNKKETTTAPNSAQKTFKGATVQFTNSKGGQTFISSNLNNTYIAFVRNEYAKNGINCPPGRLAYVQIPDLDQVFVFQFDNVNTWKSSTLEQVQIFADKNDLSKYFSFFTKDTGSVEYLAAKKYAQIRWAEFSTGEDAVDYASMQAILVALADDPNFQKVIDESYQ